MVKKREIFGFSLFDFANSAYTTVIITAIYNAFFVKVIGTPFLWSITLSLSYLFVLLISPVAGAMADFQGRKKRFLFFAYILCITFTALLFFSSREHLIRTMIFIILSNLGFALSEIFVSSFLPEISTKENIGRISGYAWSFGYVGGIASLICCLGYLSITGYGDTAVRATTLVTAVFFTIFAMPCFFLLKERKKGESLPPGQHLLTVGFNRLINTYREIRQYRELFKFLAAFFFYTCGTVTVISFAAIYAQGVLLFSRLTLVLWLSAVLGTYFIKEKTSFWVIANLVGFAMGAIQSASRSLIGLFSPVHKSAEFYGFWGFSGKAAAIVGLFSFGALLKLFNGDMRQAVLFTSLFFIIGFLMMLRIHPNKGVNT
jgi:UMF1 family MFS transporter